MMAGVYRIYPKKSRNFFSNFSITYWIISINVLVWVSIIVSLLINSNNIQFFALQPTNFIQGKFLWTIIVSMFSHVALWHLFANMVTLSFIGGFIEKLIGRKRYLSFYLISGVLASLFFIFLSILFGRSDLGAALFGNPEIYALGASGAIFGLAGLITILIPRMKVLAFFIIPMRMWVAMVFFLGFFWILSVFAGLPIGNSAHLGGFLVGISYGLYLKFKFPNKTKALSKHFS